MKAVAILILFLQAQLFALKFSNTSVDFGKINWTSIVSKEIQIHNDSKKAISVKTKVSCDCLEIIPSSVKILPQKSQNFKIIFNPYERKGKVNYSIFFEMDDPEISFVRLFASAEVKPFFEVFLFYDENCKECEDIIEKLKNLSSRYSLKLKKFLISDLKNFEFLKYLEKIYEIESQEFPVLFAGKKFLSGTENILTNVEDILKNFSPHSDKIFEFKSEKVKKDILNEFKNFKLLPILLAALSDGINPCAFAGIIFLVSYLSLVSRKSSGEVFLFGIGYTIGVGVFYFLFGLGILEFIKSIAFFKVIGRIFYFILACGTFVLGFLSFVDAVRFKKSGKIILKIPDSFSKKMKEKTLKYLKKKNLFLYSFLIGGIVSSFEFICTGQIYLPTISYLVSITNYNPAYIFALVFYTVFFLLPLFGVFMFVYLGRNFIYISAAFNKRISLIKVINGIIFLIFTIFLFGFVFRR